MSSARLVFAYAVDGGVFSSLANYAHKLISPSTYQCNLCALTYGAFGTEKAWTAFIRDLGIPTEFLHRDEFVQKHPELRDRLPAVYVERDAGLQMLITSEEITACGRLDDLISLVRDKVEALR